MRSRQDSPSSLRQTITSRVDEAEGLFLRIRHFLLSAGLSSLCFQVELLARECVMNAIVHGNQKVADNPVEISILVGPKWIRLQVSDQGAGFSWQNSGKKRPTSGSCSGRGLRLCRLYADRVRFSRRGNRIALWISRKGREG